MNFKYCFGILFMIPFAAVAQNVRDKANFIEAENKFYQHRLFKRAKFFRVVGSFDAYRMR